MKNTKINDLNKLLDEAESQVANGPELGDTKQLDNEATDEKKPAESNADVKSTDVYTADEHDQKDEVGEVVVTESEDNEDDKKDDAKEDSKDDTEDKSDDKDDKSEDKEDDKSEDKDSKDEDSKDDKEDKSEDDNDEDEVKLDEEESQTANGPELGDTKQLDNEATEDKKPETKEPDTASTDVYDADSHDQKDEVGEVVVTESLIKKAKIKNGSGNSVGNSISKDASSKVNGVNAAGQSAKVGKDQIIDNTRNRSITNKITATDNKVSSNSNFAVNGRAGNNTSGIQAGKDIKIKGSGINIKENAISENDLEPDTEVVDGISKFDDGIETPIEATKDIVDDLDATLADTSVEDAAEEAEDTTEASITESLNSIFALLKGMNESESQTANGPELGDTKQLDNEATDEKKPEESAEKVSSKDVYCDNTHDQKEEVGEVLVKESAYTDLDLMNILKENGYQPTLKNLSILKEGIATGKYIIEFDGLNEEESQTANGPELGDTKQLDNEATDEKKPEESKADVKSTDVYCDDCHDQKDEVGEVVVKESESQTANGPELGDTKQLDNEATDEKAPEESAEKVSSKDVYNDKEHDQVEDVVEVVVEAVNRCKKAGKKATKANICEEVRALREEKGDVTDLIGTGKDFKDKEYDEDAAENSAEENGSETAFKKYDEIDGKGAYAALTGVAGGVKNETVQYKSLKEACALDKDYFTTDSYTIQTSSQKINKLTEQVSLLIAKESMDPMYDELLKQSVYTQRLQEALINKYSAKAEPRVNEMIGKEQE